MARFVKLQQVVHVAGSTAIKDVYVNPELVAYFNPTHNNPKTTNVTFDGDTWIEINMPADDLNFALKRTP